MNIKYMAGIALAALTLFSCDDTTDTIGGSLTDNVDKLEISTDTFQVETRSILADSVLSRSVTGYLGKVRDPETGAYMTGDFMTQFYTPEGFSFPEKDSIVSKKDGLIVADSCDRILRRLTGDDEGYGYGAQQARGRAEVLLFQLRPRERRLREERL